MSPNASRALQKGKQKWSGVMTILTTCPKCGSTYRVKNHLVGKRFRCTVCQTAVPVETVSVEDVKPNLDQLFEDDSDDTSVEIEAGEPTQDELVLTRLKFTDDGKFTDDEQEERRPKLSPLQRFLVRAARNPWIG